MKIKSLLLVVTLLAAVSVQAEVYKWVDDKGAIVYSDTPQKGAEKMELPEVDTYEGADEGASDNLPVFTSEGSTAGDAPAYKSFVIKQPVNNLTIRDNTGTIVVTFKSVPDLRGGDEVVITLGENTVRVAATAHTFTGIERGEHIIRAHIEDSEGNTVSPTAQSKVHLKKTSVIQNRRINPPTSTN